MKKTFIFATIYLIATSCMDSFDHKYVFINNQSNSSIYSIISNNDEMFDYGKFQTKQRLDNGEKISNIDITGLYISEEQKINSRTKQKGPYDWKRYIKNSRDKKIRLYIISKDSIDKYSWEYIHHNSIYNKKYILTLNELEKLDWEISYK